MDLNGSSAIVTGGASGIGLACGKRLAAQVSPRRISALINLWGLLLVTPFGLWQALSYDFRAVTLPSWGLLLFYSLAASVATVWLWMRGLRVVPASRARAGVCGPSCAASPPAMPSMACSGPARSHKPGSR